MLRVGMLIEPVFRDGVGIPGEPVAGTVGGNCQAVLDPQRRLGDPIRPPIDVFGAAVRQYGPLELILSKMLRSHIKPVHMPPAPPLFRSGSSSIEGGHCLQSKLRAPPAHGSPAWLEGLVTGRA